MIEKKCEITGLPFLVSESEEDAYRSFDIPLPDISPEERFRRQLLFRNDRRFFWRNCAATGERVFSIYPESAPFLVVSSEFWESKRNNPLRYGREYRPGIPFFEQLFDLWRAVPRPATMVSAGNAEAAHIAFDVTNSFVVFDAHRSSSCFYSVNLWDCSWCGDCLNCLSCDSCYECVNCLNSSFLRWSDNCVQCANSAFLSNCVDCEQCLFCVNLKSKRYHVFNQQVSPEEYRNFISQLNLDCRAGLEDAFERFRVFLRDKPVPEIVGLNGDAISGNYLFNCHGVIDSFECFDSTDLVHCSSLSYATNCVDGFGFGDGLSHAAQFVNCGRSARNLISCIECTENVANLSYCGHCRNSDELFACVGLSNEHYCILNRRYPKSEYLALKQHIESELRRDGVWGAFFPGRFSGFPYNVSAAQDVFPLSRVQAKLLGLAWDDSADDYLRPSQLLASSDGAPEERFTEAPETAQEALAGDLDLSSVYLCEMTGRPYQLTKIELEFYQRLEIAPPNCSFERRHYERRRLLKSRGMYSRRSDFSGKPLRTAFPADYMRPVWGLDELSEDS